MRVILKHDLLKPEGFDLKGIAPCDLCLYAGDASNTEWRHLQPHVRAAASQQSLSQILPHWAPAIQAYAPPGALLGQNVCGFGLVAEASNKRATLGGVLIIDGDFYGLTSAHVLDEASPTKDPGTPADAQMYDSAWAEQESDESDDEIIAQFPPSSKQVALTSRLPMLNEDSHLIVGESIHIRPGEYCSSPCRLYNCRLKA